MRADAQRNRRLITERAAALLRASGTGVSMEQIAADAGVGVGTVYRHFADKAALIDAIAALRVRQLAEDAVRSAGERAAHRPRVRTLLEAYMASAAEDGALRAALRGHAAVLGTDVRLAIEESEGPIGDLIAADQAQGLLRAEFSFADFRAVCAAVVSVMDPPAPGDAWERVLALVVTGMQPPRHTAPGTIHFHQEHHDAVLSGEKVTTVRWNESVAVGPATFVFDGHPTAEPLAGTVIAVHQHRLDTLTAEQAHQPPGTDMRLFGQQLRENHYPDMPDDAVVEVAELTVEPS